MRELRTPFVLRCLAESDRDENCNEFCAKRICRCFAARDDEVVVLMRIIIQVQVERRAGDRWEEFGRKS